MIEPVRLGKEELKARYGCGERFAVRVGALRARGVEISSAALEEVLAREDLQRLFLSPELLKAADRLDTSRLQKLGPAARGLAVFKGVLALEEELQAERAWSEESRKPKLPAVDPARPPAWSPGPAEVSLAELRRVLSAEDVARLKLVLLTGVDPPAKIEALRKLALAPAPAEEKGVLALRGLSDPASEVRREAAAMLESIGLTSELADALKTAAGGTPRQKEIALQKLSTLGRRSSSVERMVALAFLTGALAHERETDVLRAVLGAMVPYGDLLAGHPAALTPLARNLTNVLADRFVDVAAPARALLEAVSALKSAELAKILWREVDGVADRRIRSVFLEALLGMDLPEDLERTLCRAAVDVISRATLEDLETRRLADALRRRGDAALETLLALMPELKDEGRALLFPVLDSIAASDAVRASLRNKVGDYFLSVLREGNRSLRTMIMEAQVGRHPGLAPEIKRKLAADFIFNLHAYQLSRIHDLTMDALRRLGWEAAESLRACVQKSPYPVEREAAAQLLGEIASEASDPERVLQVVRFLQAQEAAARVPPGISVRSIARAAHGPVVPAELHADILRGCQERLGRGANGADVVAALGWLASSPVCDPGSATDTALKMLELLDRPLPELDVDEMKTDEGTHLFVGAQSSVYTDLLPELIAAVRRILLGGRVAPGARIRILDRLMERYRALVEYREIWAPGNVVELGATLGALAASPHVGAPERTRLLETLLADLRHLSTVRLLGGVFTRYDEDDEEYVALLGRYLDQVFAMLDRPEYQEWEDRKVLLEALAKTAAHRRLDGARRRGEAKRQRIVELLLEHSDRLREAKAFLRILAASEHVPQALRRRALHASKSERDPHE
ncbi:MAG: hypothetical protein HY716_10220 [Planctomycetes bacterium]|nr:hypothetical protein [Planctomycetota bacterium]